MISLQPVGYIRSTLRAVNDAPRQGPEGAPVKIGPIEAIDGTPVVDIKVVYDGGGA